ncbi:uncharacterized protein PRCAT00000934001 [Priceomyces carsonii]|uniref:uncharacterized protein n=1 Tax=Priceomyces carsonii TaxID=28549 RepID=UPI002EDB897D|nr:unnamed protein product [Priceomyces carsonii]
MISLFKIANAIACTIYPVFASYKSFEEYSKVVSRMGASNISIAGFNVPIQALLKRATGDNTEQLGKDEELLQTHLLTIQKWLIYWMVTASCSVVESVLFLRYIVPFYSFFKFLFSLWLISPMFSTSTKVSGISEINREKEWAYFTDNGAGFVYYKFIKPWLDGELNVLSKLPFEPQKVFNSCVDRIGFSNALKMMGFMSADQSEEGQTANDGIIYTLRSYLFDMNGITRGSTSTATTATEASSYKDVVEEYDLVDKPIVKDGVTQRKTGSSEETVKKGWLW